MKSNNLWLRSSGKTDALCRQQATANNRNFRSLTFPRRNFSIGVGSVQLGHSDSVMGGPLPCSTFFSRQQQGILNAGGSPQEGASFLADLRAEIPAFVAEIKPLFSGEMMRDGP
jgi:hypothetical protein